LNFGVPTGCPKVDVFAAGVILYFMLRGKLPFSAETQDGTLELLGSVGWFHDSSAMPAVMGD
jgi:serine/threonine protein kinase